MRMLVDIQMPLEPFNARVKDGTAGQIVQSILAELKPEAADFAARDWKRGGTIVLDVADSSKLASINARHSTRPHESRPTTVPTTGLARSCALRRRWENRTAGRSPDRRSGPNQVSGCS